MSLFKNNYSQMLAKVTNGDNDSEKKTRYVVNEQSVCMCVWCVCALVRVGAGREQEKADV